MPVGDQLFQLWHQLRTREEYVIAAGANFSGKTKAELLQEIIAVKEAHGLPVHRWKPVSKPAAPDGRPWRVPWGTISFFGPLFGLVFWLILEAMMK